MRFSVEQFANAMNAKLDENNHKGESWKTDKGLAWLLDCLEAELKELKEAAENLDLPEVRRECVDVANFAMFLHWRIGKLLEEDNGNQDG